MSFKNVFKSIFIPVPDAPIPVGPMGPPPAPDGEEDEEEAACSQQTDHSPPPQDPVTTPRARRQERTGSHEPPRDLEMEIEKSRNLISQTILLSEGYDFWEAYV